MPPAGAEFPSGLAGRVNQIRAEIERIDSEEFTADAAEAAQPRRIEAPIW
jgi:hypothetical protein